MIGVAEWKHLGSDFGWESGRICANLTRPPAEGREREQGKRGKGRRGGGERQRVGLLNRNSLSDMYFFSTARTSDSHRFLTHKRLIKLISQSCTEVFELTQKRHFMN